MPLNEQEKSRLAQKHLVPITNNMRKVERLAVQHASHREIEVTANCLHVLLNDLRKDLGIPFNEADVEPSIYGESGDPKP